MKFFLVILSICCYIISQTTIHARTTGLRKAYWSPRINGDYQGDFHHQKSNRRRQAGMFGIVCFSFLFSTKFRLGKTSWCINRRWLWRTSILSSLWFTRQFSSYLVWGYMNILTSCSYLYIYIKHMLKTKDFK